LSGVCAAHGGRRVLEQVTCAFRPGRFTAVLGPNGAGKSTLLRVALGLHPVVSGEVQLDGRPLEDWDRRELARAAAWVPQRPEGVGGFTALEQVLLGRTPHLGMLGLTGPADAARAEALLEGLGLRGVADRPLEALSGGEQRLVLFARALAQEAPRLLLDEPTAHLDLRHQVALLSRAKGLASGGALVAAVLHDVNLASAWADDVVLLKEGRVLGYGPAGEWLREGPLEALYGVPMEQADTGGQRLFAPRAGQGASRT
jgi:iron complex transport system ATP-binding protein